MVKETSVDEILADSQKLESRWRKLVSQGLQRGMLAGGKPLHHQNPGGAWTLEKFSIMVVVVRYRKRWGKEPGRSP